MLRPCFVASVRDRPGADSTQKLRKGGRAGDLLPTRESSSQFLDDALPAGVEDKGDLPFLSSLVCFELVGKILDGTKIPLQMHFGTFRGQIRRPRNLKTTSTLRAC
jgi:hypothetical protein